MHPFLPTEILLDIFCQLEYFDLLDIRRVSRHFRDIIDGTTPHSKLAPLLFREAYEHGKTYPSISSLAVHPSLLKLTVRPKAAGKIYPEDFPLGVSDYGFTSPSGTFIPLSDTGAAHENVFSPAISKMHWRVTWGSVSRLPYRSEEPLEAPNRGITVARLIEEMDVTLGGAGWQFHERFHSKPVFDTDVKLFSRTSKKKIELLGDELEIMPSLWMHCAGSVDGRTAT